jgi:hypothetical protein
MKHPLRCEHHPAANGRHTILAPATAPPWLPAAQRPSIAEKRNHKSICLCEHMLLTIEHILQ